MKNKNEDISLISLPVEIVNNTLDYLDLPSLQNLQYVNTFFNKVCGQHIKVKQRLRLIDSFYEDKYVEILHELRPTLESSHHVGFLKKNQFVVFWNAMDNEGIIGYDLKLNKTLWQWKDRYIPLILDQTKTSLIVDDVIVFIIKEKQNEALLILDLFSGEKLFFGKKPIIEIYQDNVISYMGHGKFEIQFFEQNEILIREEIYENCNEECPYSPNLKLLASENYFVLINCEKPDVKIFDRKTREILSLDIEKNLEKITAGNFTSNQCLMLVVQKKEDETLSNQLLIIKLGTLKITKQYSLQPGSWTEVVGEPNCIFLSKIEPMQGEVIVIKNHLEKCLFTLRKPLDQIILNLKDGIFTAECIPSNSHSHTYFAIASIDSTHNVFVKQGVCKYQWHQDEKNLIKLANVDGQLKLYEYDYQKPKMEPTKVVEIEEETGNRFTCCTLL